MEGLVKEVKEPPDHLQFGTKPRSSRKLEAAWAYMEMKCEESRETKRKKEKSEEVIRKKKKDWQLQGGRSYLPPLQQGEENQKREGAL